MNRKHLEREAVAACDDGGILPMVPGARGGTMKGIDRQPSSDTGKPTFALTLEALPSWDKAPAINRLRRFLKMALRSYGLKCTEAREITPALPDAAGRMRTPPAATENGR